MPSTFLASLLVSTATSLLAASSEVVQYQQVRPLPGSLNNFPLLHSNSPEVINSGGILLSTFPPSGKNSPRAHLNYAVSGEFHIFSHHVTRQGSTSGRRSLYHGILLHNPSRKPAKAKVLQGASYLSSAHAPFIWLKDQIVDPVGKVFSGPGSRISSDILRGKSQPGWPSEVVIPPGSSYMLINRAIPPSNSRTTQMRLWTDGQLYVASMAKHGGYGYKPPTLTDWQVLLTKGDLINPRDRVPSPPNFQGEKLIYGRVAGVAKGAEWQGIVTDSPNSDVLRIPESGQGFSYPISTLPRGTLGTGQVQSAPMLKRYADTAYLSHGNYGLKYDLDFPLNNSSRRAQNVTISLQTPLKEDRLTRKGLRFLQSPSTGICFRGTLKLSFPQGQPNSSIPQQQYVHLVQRCGQQGKPLVTLTIPPKETTLVKVELLYPADSTPPQVLTIRTL
jgi:hypothetical protein